MRTLSAALLLAGAFYLAAREAPAQQVTVSTPFHSAGDGFFERIGTSWGFSTRGLNFSFGSPINPQFGNFDPNAGLNASFTFGRPGNGGFFNFSAGQGYSQTAVTQAPVVTLMNGQPGFVADTSISPFVIGYVPVVGGFPMVGPLYPMMPLPAYPPFDPGPAVSMGNPRVQAMLQATAERNPGSVPNFAQRKRDVPPANEQPAAAGQDAAVDKLSSAQASSAGRAVPSVAEARRLNELERSSEAGQAAVLYERARAAEEDGKPNVARIYYEMVARRASGELKEQALARLAAIRGETSP